jgi:hypothetical protein
MPSSAAQPYPTTVLRRTFLVGEFLEKGFPFISVGNDLHHNPDPGGRLRERRGSCLEGKRQGLEPARHRVALSFGRDNPQLAFDAAG